MIAFALSAVLSPYLVLPLGTVGIIGSVAQPTRTFLLFTSISVFFSTVLPALFVVFQIWRGKITDVHVMEREQRGGPFLVAIFSSAVGAWVLHAIGAPMTVWGISAVLTLNGVILTWITSFWKISMHVAVLSATVMAAIAMIPQTTAWPLLILIPSLMWARIVRGRHTLWQGIAGALLAMFITYGSLTLLYFVYDPATRKAIMSQFGYVQ
jgi:membrane-associated phospholipid phosphatase